MMRLLTIVFLLATYYTGICQPVVGETEIIFKKPPLPYDIQSVYALKDDELVVLKQDKKLNYVLKTYDSYMFAKWSINLIIGRDESTPQLNVKGDSIYVVTYSKIKGENIGLQVRLYNAADGQSIWQYNYIVSGPYHEGAPAGVSFSDNMAYAVCHYVDPATGIMHIKRYQMGEVAPVSEFSLADKQWIEKTVAMDIENDGSLFIAFVDPLAFKVKVKYASITETEFKSLESNFIFNRPLDKSGKIHIVKTNQTTINVIFGAYIGNELIGINVSGYNIVLNSEVFNRTLDMNAETTGQCYSNSVKTNVKMKKKLLQAPEALNDFYLTQVEIASDGTLVSLFEKSEVSSLYHQTLTDNNLPNKMKVDEDKRIISEDILIFGMEADGQIKYSGVLQKQQIGLGHGLSNSYVSHTSGDNLNFLLWDIEKGGTLYRCTLDLKNGIFSTPERLLDKRFGLDKRYSTWINGEKLVIGTTKPNNYKKVTLKLVELKE